MCFGHWLYHKKTLKGKSFGRHIPSGAVLKNVARRFRTQRPFRHRQPPSIRDPDPLPPSGKTFLSFFGKLISIL